MAGGHHISWPLVQFSIIGEAWRLYKRQWFIWSLAMLMVIIGYSIVNGTLLALLGEGPPHNPGGFRMTLVMGQGLAYLVSSMCAGFFLGGLVRMATKQVQGHEARIEDLFSITDVWFDLLLSSLLYGAATFIGTMFCVIPGLIVSGLFMLAIPLVVEARLPATGALIQSWNALKAQWLMATVLHIVLMLVAISGSLLCGIGVLMTGPLYSLSLAILYHDFFPTSGMTAEKEHTGPYPEI